MKPEDIIKIAKAALRRISPSMQSSIDQMEGSTNREIQLGVESMKRAMDRQENIIAEAIREALAIEQGESTDPEEALLDYEVVEAWGDEWQVWTPGYPSGACIGSGDSRQEAKDNAIRASKWLIAELSKSA